MAAAFGKVNAGFTDSIYAICMGLVHGWIHTIYVGTGTPIEPQASFWISQADSNHSVRCVYSYWAGLVRNGLYQYSLNGGVNYTTIGTLNFWYDNDSNLLSASWS